MTASFVAIRRVRSYLEIVDQIAASIREGRISAGEKLPAERALAVQFGTGRQCLREALSVLEVLGVIDVRKGWGTFVTENAVQRLAVGPLTAEALGDPFELMEARLLLEPRVAGLAARRGDSESVRQMESLLGEMAVCLSEGRHPTQEDKRLHVTIARGSGNQVLVKLVNELIGNMGKPLWVSFKERSRQVEGLDASYLAEHTDIVAAIKDRDSALATRRMRAHLEKVAQHVLK
jgi:GntR family transcriptional repressor for pyruvate dehydrogenase complex